MNTYYDIRFLRPTQLFSLGLLSVPPHIAVSETGPLTKTRPAHHLAGVHKRDVPYSARRGPRRRAQTWRSLFIAPCALREATGKGRVPWDKSASQRAWGGRVSEIGDFGLATASMDNPS
jgi:hypothetical protein